MWIITHYQAELQLGRLCREGEQLHYYETVIIGCYDKNFN